MIGSLRYWASRMFAPRYWLKATSGTVVPFSSARVRSLSNLTPTRTVTSLTPARTLQIVEED